MVTVIEHWYLTKAAASDALAVMQAMDDLVEDNAHAHEGWDGHARFFQVDSDPQHVVMIYSWRSRGSAEDMLESEREILAQFVREYCTRDRVVEFASELPVDV